jgi:hypothetical protein
LAAEVAESYNLDEPLLCKKKEEFRECLIESIEEVLSFSKVVLNFLELNTPFKCKEIIECPEVFSSELRDLFGQSAIGIEDLIIERFFKKIDIKYEKDRNKKFEYYIKDALKGYTEYY